MHGLDVTCTMIVLLSATTGLSYLDSVECVISKYFPLLTVSGYRF